MHIALVLPQLAFPFEHHVARVAFMPYSCAAGELLAGTLQKAWPWRKRHFFGHELQHLDYVVQIFVPPKLAKHWREQALNDSLQLLAPFKYEKQFKVALTQSVAQLGRVQICPETILDSGPGIRLLCPSKLHPWQIYHLEDIQHMR